MGQVLTSSPYGKQKVRVMKILRDGSIPTIKEHTVATDTEQFLTYLGPHFVGKYPQVQTATITSAERAC